MKSAAQSHPPFLTPTERRRFISSYYQLWTLMYSDRTARQRKLEETPLKRLFIWNELRPAQIDADDSTLWDLFGSDRVEEVFQDIRTRIVSVTRCFNHLDISLGIGFMIGSPTPFNIIAIFDFFQPFFKSLLLDKWQMLGCVLDPASEGSCLWYDTTDNEDG